MPPRTSSGSQATRSPPSSSASQPSFIPRPPWGRRVTMARPGPQPRRRDDRQRRQASSWLVLVVMCVGYFLVLLDVTIVNIGLPRIGSGLHAGVSGLQWVVDGYALALASLMLPGGTAGDLHGHKRVVMGGLVVFGAGSLGCGVAPTASVLVGMRVLQGL